MFVLAGPVVLVNVIFVEAVHSVFCAGRMSD